MARYTAQLGEVAATRMPDVHGNVSPFSARGVGTRKLGDVFALDVSPRVWLGHTLYLAGHYGLRTRADDEYAFPRSGVDDAPILPGVAPLPETGTAGTPSCSMYWLVSRHLLWRSSVLLMGGNCSARSCGRCAALSIPALGISRVPSPIGMEVSGFITTSHYAHHSWPPMADKCSYMDDLLCAGAPHVLTGSRPSNAL